MTLFFGLDGIIEPIIILFNKKVYKCPKCLNITKKTPYKCVCEQNRRTKKKCLRSSIIQDFALYKKKGSLHGKNKV